jgi:hypothetical protein
MTWLALALCASPALADAPADVSLQEDALPIEQERPQKPPQGKPQDKPTQKPPQGKPAQGKPPQGKPPQKPAPKGPEWIVEPFIDPHVGVTSVTINGDTGVQATAGGEAGYHYTWTGDPKLVGETRIGATLLYGLTSNSIGYDVRIGSFIGPKLGDLVLQAGPDLFYNGYGQAGASDYNLPATGGLSLPVTATYTPITEVGVSGRITPSWVFNPERRSSIEIGPFDELTAYLGANLSLGEVRGSVGYQWQWTSQGVIQGVVVSGGLSL